ncbi:hypothetical protein F4861DRAFT_50100 [Xylaria intraflava]|nr:hypothetical protein F4861DRAFT_50100 [Xylaria intraflava]
MPVGGGCVTNKRVSQLMLALIAVAIYIQATSSALSLPISTGLNVLTILIPLFTTAIIFYTPVLNRLAGSSIPRQLLAPSLHVLHGGLALVIATLAAQGFIPGRILKCGLEGNWQQLWHTHDGRAIERIQNTFDCCGFHSLRDRGWPQEQCADIYNRHISCDAPWRASMQRTSGLQFAVAVLVGIIQLGYLAYLRQRSWRARGAQDFKRFPQRVGAGEHERLIENGIEPYDDGDEASGDANPSASRSSLPAAEDSAPHRVEPSGLGRDDVNEWRS